MTARFSRSENRRSTVFIIERVVFRSNGQATTEVVLLFPMFMFFMFAFAKIFALLVLVQKLEIASYYAARRWQLESHRNVNFQTFDRGPLKSNIESYVNSYLGFGPGGRETDTTYFLGLTGPAQLSVTPTQVWQIVTLSVRTRPIRLPYLKNDGYKLEVTKYVPNRDRPIAFVLPGLEKK